MELRKWRRRRESSGPCSACGVLTPNLASDGRCRCCLADDDPFHRVYGADTLASGDIMPPAPIWPKGVGNFPRLETAFAFNRPGPSWLWWVPKGRQWVPQHPLEFPRNRLKDLTSNL